MFYAPWDVDSMRARDTLEEVAAVFEDHTDLYFAAVNCWTTEGECYREFGEGKKADNSGVKGKFNPANQVRTWLRIVIDLFTSLFFASFPFSCSTHANVAASSTTAP